MPTWQQYYSIYAFLVLAGGGQMTQAGINRVHLQGLHFLLS